MASIPNEFIDELINRVDIYDVVSPRVSLKKAGKDYSGLCPFHNENSPSFTVSQQKQFFHCFGCGKNGSAIGFLMEYEGLDFVDAVKDLAQMAGMEVPLAKSNKPQISKNLYAVTEKAARIFQHQLKDNEATITYLKNRGISGPTAKVFQIGYAKDAWDGIMKRFDFQEHNLLAESGLTTNNDSGKVYDKFRNRLMFPIHDRRGRVIAFGGRAIEADQKPKYLNSPETPLFHKGNELYAFHLARKHSDDNFILVVEGYMDVVALFENGVKNAVATLGTATSAQHIQNLFKVWDKIIFCFDGDRAGKQAAAKALETALPQYLDHKTISFLFLPDGQDPDSFVFEQGEQAFRELCDQAKPLSEFLIENISNDIATDTIDGQAQLFHKAQEPLNRLPKGAFRQMMMKRIETLTQHQFKKQAQVRPKRQQESSKSPVKKIISLLVNLPTLHKLIPETLDLHAFQFKGVEIIDRIVEICQSQPHISTAALIEHFRNASFFQHLAPLSKHYDHLDNDQKTLEFKDLMNHLLKKAQQKEIDALREKQMQSGLTIEEKQQLVNLLTTKVN